MQKDATIPPTFTKILIKMKNIETIVKPLKKIQILANVVDMKICNKLVAVLANVN